RCGGKTMRKLRQDSKRTGVVFTACFVMFSIVSGVPRPQRPFTVDDVFQLEELGPISVSADGHWLAYVLKRARSKTVLYKYGYLLGNDRADIWVSPTDGGPPRNVTEGEIDGSGFWSPAWSPDGQRLAMLSNRGGNIHLWIWERASGRLKQAAPEAVDS